MTRPFDTNTHPGVTHRARSRPAPEPSVPAQGTSFRRQVFERDRTCRHCGTGEGLTLDHIVPLSNGGCGCPENLQVLCGRCNVHKRNGRDYKGALGHRASDCPRSR